MIQYTSLKITTAIFIISMMLGGCAGNIQESVPLLQPPFQQSSQQSVVPLSVAPLWVENHLISLATQVASDYGIDRHLFYALIKQESNWNPWAKSSKGARGLTQLMPQTGKSQCGLDRDVLFHPELNLRCGASYFNKLLRRFENVELALAAYNSGETRVARLGRVPYIRETQHYVRKIMSDWYYSKCNGRSCSLN